MKDTQDVIIRLLDNIGSRKEVEQYLRHYTSGSAPKFAVVKASGAIIESRLEAFASSLAFLQRVGLVPIVVHGGNVQLDRALAQAGVDAPVVRGLRKITPAALEVARRVLHETNLKVVEAVEALGTRARPFTSGVFDVKKIETPDLGLVGEITGVHEAAVAKAALAGILPVVAPLGETSKGQILIAHADAAARAIALAVKPHKVVYLSDVGGLLDENGTLRSAVNLAEDRDALLADETLGPESRRKLLEIDALLSELPKSSSVSITSPEHLARELFTHRGAGTLVRLGEKVLRHETRPRAEGAPVGGVGAEPQDAWSSIDLVRMRALLEESFGRKLDDAYFDYKTPYRVYLAESYRATAILTLIEGVPYLDKFAVTNEAQGEGIGGSIWQRLKRENPKLFWRSRAQNPLNTWYAQNADGLFKTEKWWVFWCGMEDWNEIRTSVEHALAMKATLHDPEATLPPGAVSPPETAAPDPAPEAAAVAAPSTS